MHRLIGSAQPICHATRSLAALHGEPRSLQCYSERIPAMSQRTMCLQNTAEQGSQLLQCSDISTITSSNHNRERRSVSRSYRGRTSSLQNQCSPSSAKVKNKWRYTPVTPVCLYEEDRDSFAFLCLAPGNNSVTAVNGVRKLPRMNTTLSHCLCSGRKDW